MNKNSETNKKQIPIKITKIGMDYNIDAHGMELLRQYRKQLPVFQRMKEIVLKSLKDALQQQGVYVTSIEGRVKEEASLAGKLERKGMKYQSLGDITDILGVRIITFYTDDVDKVAAIVKSTFSIDWKESVDKRKLHELTSFGYNSLHYICRLPKSLVNDPQMPEMNEIRFEMQMRTALQHVWSTIEHDTGYKSGVKLPPEYRRQFSRLAGMLELIDDEFSRLRTELTEYHRRVKRLTASGKLNEVPLDEESFRNYLELNPFERLNYRIAAANQAEILPASLLPYLPVLQSFQFETLDDVEHFIADNSDDAYLLALSQLAVTDLDIISENVGIQNLCIVHILKHGGGRPGIKQFYDRINGKRADNELLADTIMHQAASLPFM